MQIVQRDDVPLVRGLEYRGGTFHSQVVLRGIEGSLGNFQLSLGQTGGDFFSPRHRHNFEQFRVQLEGTLDFARDGKMKPGMVGYFPEGVRYGPQSQDPDEKPLTAVLQFGGASGSGYLSNRQVRAGTEALKAYGTFKDGVFRRNEGVEGRRNTDAYQAIWEHVHGEPMRYPEGRYDKPVFMDSAHFAWVPVAGAAGVEDKLLGVFTERRSLARFVRIRAGRQYQLEGRGVFLAISGAGRVGDQPLRACTSIALEAGEQVRLSADEETVLVHLGLPDLADLEAGLHAEAAE
ncbi:MAG TPA: hypothetical protein VHD15_11860 [Hyphomicrobiales bacterium]|nr:hypothetical protein [Hyphomicrobiales bacterium]